MAFIEDENGLAFYFTRDQWKNITNYLCFTLDNSWGYDGEEIQNIIDTINKRLGH